MTTNYVLKETDKCSPAGHKKSVLFYICL